MIIEFNKKNIPKSPTFLLDHFRIVTVIFALAILASYFFIDRPLSLFFQKAPDWLEDIGNLISAVTAPSVVPVLLAVLFLYVRFF